MEYRLDVNSIKWSSLKYLQLTNLLDIVNETNVSLTTTLDT